MGVIVLFCCDDLRRLIVPSPPRVRSSLSLLHVVVLQPQQRRAQGDGRGGGGGDGGVGVARLPRVEAQGEVAPHSQGRVSNPRHGQRHGHGGAGQGEAQKGEVDRLWGKLRAADRGDGREI